VWRAVHHARAAEEVPVDVVKRDGSTQRFDRRKLLRGLVRAAGGRPVGGDALEALADAIAAEVHGAGPRVGAERIGDLAERGLARLDPVTAIQFASVYRRLVDLDELEEVVRRLRDEPGPSDDQLPLEEASPASFPSEPGGSMPSPATPLAGHGTSRRRRHAH